VKEPMISAYLLAGLNAMEQTTTGSDRCFIQVLLTAAKLLCCLWELGLQSSNCQSSWKDVLDVLLTNFTLTNPKPQTLTINASFHDSFKSVQCAFMRVYSLFNH